MHTVAFVTSMPDNNAMLPILNQSLWRDEAFSLLLALKQPMDIIQTTARDVSPPLHYIVLHYWLMVFGNSEVVARSLSLFFQAGTGVVGFFIFWKLTRSWVGSTLVAVAILLNPFLLQYAFEARAYSMLAFLTVTAVLLVILKRYFLAGLVLGLSILTHNFAVFNTVAFFVYFLLLFKKKFFCSQTLAFFAIPTLTILLWGAVIWNQWTKVAGGFWIEQTSSSIFIHTFELFSSGDLGYLMQPMVYTVTILIVFFAFSYWIWKSKKEESSIPLLFACLAFIPIVITYIISTYFTPIYHERYLIASLPMFILFCGYSLFGLYIGKKTVSLVLTVVISLYILLLVQASEQVTATSTKKSINWGVTQVLSQAQPGDIIIPQSYLNYLEVLYYVKQSGKNVPVYAYSKTGKVPFYIGSVLYDPAFILTSYPKLNRIWEIAPDGGYKLKTF